jgi:hypothetical protein
MKRAWGILLLLCAGWAAAHATFVFGEVEVEPNPPRPGEPFTLRITMEDPSLTPVEDAILFVELRPIVGAAQPLPAPSTEAPTLPPALRTLRLIEVAPAVYAEQVTLPAAERYHLLVRDQTFPWEEANASVVLVVGGEAPLAGLPFILPPTQVAPRSLWTWIAWLIGIPLAAGLVVTVLVLRGGGGKGTA